MNIETFKAFFVTLIIEFLTYFKPLGDEIFILGMVFVVNFFCGLLNDIIVKKKSFQFRKAWSCIVQITTFFAMVFFVYTFGEKKGWNIGAIQCVSFLTYVVTWFYSQNSLKNLKELFRIGTPARRVCEFLFYILSVEFIKDIPFLTKYLAVEAEAGLSEDSTQPKDDKE